MSWRSGVVAKKKRKEKKRKDIWFSHPTARGGGSLQNGRGLGFRLQKRLQPQWLATLPRQTVSIFPRPSGTRPSQPSHEGHELPAESIATFTKPKHGRPAACRSKQQHRRREAAVSRNWRFLAAKQTTLFRISDQGWQRCATKSSAPARHPFRLRNPHLRGGLSRGATRCASRLH